MISYVYGFPIYKTKVSDKILLREETKKNLEIGYFSKWKGNCLTTSTADITKAFKSKIVIDEITNM